MARYTCERCGAESNTLDAPHLCKDVAARLKRFEKRVGIVKTILAGHMTDEAEMDRIAGAIVTNLTRIGLTED